MEYYLFSEAIGDIVGSAYEERAHRIKDLVVCIKLAISLGGDTGTFIIIAGPL